MIFFVFLASNDCFQRALETRELIIMLLPLYGEGGFWKICEAKDKKKKQLNRKRKKRTWEGMCITIDMPTCNQQRPLVFLQWSSLFYIFLFSFFFFSLPFFDVWTVWRVVVRRESWLQDADDSWVPPLIWKGKEKKKKDMAFWSFLHGEKQQPTATGETKQKKICV